MHPNDSGGLRTPKVYHVLAFALLGVLALSYDSMYTGSVTTHTNKAAMTAAAGDARTAASEGTDKAECTANSKTQKNPDGTPKKIGRYCKPSATGTNSSDDSAKANCEADDSIPAGKCWIKNCSPNDPKQCFVFSDSTSESAKNPPLTDLQYRQELAGAKSGNFMPIVPDAEFKTCRACQEVSGPANTQIDFAMNVTDITPGTYKVGDNITITKFAEVVEGRNTVKVEDSATPGAAFYTSYGTLGEAVAKLQADAGPLKTEYPTAPEPSVGELQGTNNTFGQPTSKFDEQGYGYRRSMLQDPGFTWKPDVGTDLGNRVDAFKKEFPVLGATPSSDVFSRDWTKIDQTAESAEYRLGRALNPSRDSVNPGPVDVAERPIPDLQMKLGDLPDKAVWEIGTVRFEKNGDAIEVQDHGLDPTAKDTLGIKVLLNQGYSLPNVNGKTVKMEDVTVGELMADAQSSDGGQIRGLPQPATAAGSAEPTASSNETTLPRIGLNKEWREVWPGEYTTNINGKIYEVRKFEDGSVMVTDPRSDKTTTLDTSPRGTVMGTLRTNDEKIQALNAVSSESPEGVAGVGQVDQKSTNCQSESCVGGELKDPRSIPVSLPTEVEAYCKNNPRSEVCTSGLNENPTPAAIAKAVATIEKDTAACAAGTDPAACRRMAKIGGGAGAATGGGGGGQTPPNNGGGGGLGNMLSSLLGGLAKGLATPRPPTTPPMPAQACSTDPNAYAQQQQQYQQQLQQYNYQLQQYQYQQQMNQYYGNTSAYPQPMPAQPTPCTPSNQSQCATQPPPPAQSSCTGGQWTPQRSGNCITGWQCSNLGAKLTCSPQTVVVGSSLNLSYACAKGTASSQSFPVSGQSGTTSVTVAQPPQGTNTATYSLTCTDGSVTSGAECSVEVVSPSIVLVANPATVKPGETTQIGWITRGMSECVIWSPTDDAFTQQNSSNTSVSGTVVTQPLATTTPFDLDCLTINGAATYAETIVVVK